MRDDGVGGEGRDGGGDDGMGSASDDLSIDQHPDGDGDQGSYH